MRLSSEIKHIQNHYNKHTRICKYEHCEEMSRKLVELKLCNIRDYWTQIKDVAMNKYPNISMNSFYSHFKKLHQPTDITLHEVTQDIEDYVNEYVTDASTFEELNKKNSLLEINKASKSLKNNKAPGPDGVITEFVKNIPGLDKIVLPLFNNILETVNFQIAGNWPIFARSLRNGVIKIIQIIIVVSP